MNIEIKQIIPAQGWSAVFENSLKGDPIDIIYVPLAVWAIVHYIDENLKDAVIGMVPADFPEIQLCMIQSTDNAFLGYYHEGEINTPEIQERIKEEAENSKRYKENPELEYDS